MFSTAGTNMIALYGLALFFNLHCYIDIGVGYILSFEEARNVKLFTVTTTRQANLTGFYTPYFICMMKLSEHIE